MDLGQQVVKEINTQLLGTAIGNAKNNARSLKERWNQAKYRALCAQNPSAATT